ncbi:MAG: hypothetical protein LBJ84_00925 [Oscillospiraceae bacterium]|jgi:hypothetical protein|nr:hypothetical protein [Oscillospiraceae bacterium]
MTDKKITDEEMMKWLESAADDTKAHVDTYRDDPLRNETLRDYAVLTAAIAQFQALLVAEANRVTNRDITAWFEDYLHDVDDCACKDLPDYDEDMHKCAMLTAIEERLRVPLASSDGKAIDPDCFVKLREIACISRDNARRALERIEKYEDSEFIGFYKHVVAYETAFSQAYRESYATMRGITTKEAEAEIDAAEKQEGEQNEGD